MLEEIVELQPTPAYGKAYLQRIITSEFALAPHIGIEVESADDDGIVICAPLPPNANYKGSAFGGSLFSVAVLTGWAWVTRHLASSGVAADTVIQESHIRYLVPVEGTLRATVCRPTAEQVGKFMKMLGRAGRGRISVTVQIHHDRTLATEFEGVFAAALRNP